MVWWVFAGGFPSDQAEGQVTSEVVFPTDFLHNSCAFAHFQREDFSSISGGKFFIPTMAIFHSPAGFPKV
jgi:hypothetical protein